MLGSKEVILNDITGLQHEKIIHLNIYDEIQQAIAKKIRCGDNITISAIANSEEIAARKLRLIQFHNLPQ